MSLSNSFSEAGADLSSARPDAVQSPFAVSGQAVYEHLHADAYDQNGKNCPVESPKKEIDLIGLLRDTLGPQAFGPIWNLGKALSKDPSKPFDITDCFK